MVTPPKGYIKAMKEVTHKHGALFVLDEVMCGMGRRFMPLDVYQKISLIYETGMGTMHAWETYDGESPDIQAVAKGLGGG